MFTNRTTNIVKSIIFWDMTPCSLLSCTRRNCKVFKVCGFGIIKKLSRNWPGGTEENKRKTSVGKTGVPTDIWTEHLPNTDLDRYAYTNLLESSLVFGLGGGGGADNNPSP
jgi:hypothetical protein